MAGEKELPPEWLDEFTTWVKGKFEESQTDPNAPPPPPKEEPPADPPAKKKGWFSNGE